MDQLSSYSCPHCGQRVDLPIDPTAGQEQVFIEDCPVCCRPNVIRIGLDESGFATVDAEPSE
jgi:endogenous inhibitor of DNA gyrase (YacG/DUF329 family)